MEYHRRFKFALFPTIRVRAPQPPGGGAEERWRGSWGWMRVGSIRPLVACDLQRVGQLNAADRARVEHAELSEQLSPSGCADGPGETQLDFACRVRMEDQEAGRRDGADNATEQRSQVVEAAVGEDAHAAGQSVRQAGAGLGARVQPDETIELRVPARPCDAAAEPREVVGQADQHGLR